MSRMQCVLFVACLGFVFSGGWSFAQDKVNDPTEVAELKRQIQELKLENAALRKTGDAIFLERLNTSLRETRSALSENLDRVQMMTKVLKKFQDERKLLLELIADKKGDKRDGLILSLQRKIEQLINERDEAKNQLTVILNRAATALQEATSLRNELFELRKEKIPANKDQKIPNPPAFSVKGKVTMIRGAIIQINVGLDDGLQKGHTLEIYRLQPKVLYLGMVRIEDSEANVSLGRLLNKGQMKIQVGDLVADKVDQEKKAEPKPPAK